MWQRNVNYTVRLVLLKKENRSVTLNHSVSTSSIPRFTQITRTGVQIDHDK